MPSILNRKQKHRAFMKHVKGLHWKNSPNKEWAETAKSSYLKISERETWKKPETTL
jgi:hypothetical protein